MIVWVALVRAEFFKASIEVLFGSAQQLLCQVQSGEALNPVFKNKHVGGWREVKSFEMGVGCKTNVAFRKDGGGCLCKCHSSSYPEVEDMRLERDKKGINNLGKGRCAIVRR